MTPDEAVALSATVGALRDLGETMARLVQAMGRTLETANTILDRADTLLRLEVDDGSSR